MNRRVITPYSGHPSKSYLQQLAGVTDGGASVGGVGSGKQRKDSVSKDDVVNKKAKTKKKRNRTKSSDEDQLQLTDSRRKDSCNLDDTVDDMRVSMSSDTGLQDVMEERKALIKPVVEECIRKFKPVLNGGINASKAGRTLNGQLSHSTNGGQVIRITIESPKMETNGDSSEVIPNMASLGLRDVMAQQQVHERGDASDSNMVSPKARSSGKLSQKDKKRLAAEARKKESLVDSEVSLNGAEGGVKPKTWGSPQNAWNSSAGNATKAVTSFKDLLSEETTKDQHNGGNSGGSALSAPSSASKPISIPASASRDQAASGDASMSFGLALGRKPLRVSLPQFATSPRGEAASDLSNNPWQPMSPSVAAVAALAASPITPLPVNFTDIVDDETKQKESLWKIANKPLNHIQIEERAIQELLALYKEKEVIPNVKISVSRVEITLATPLWEGKQANRK